MDTVTLSLLGSIIVMQFYLIVSHERRLAKLENHVSQILKKLEKVVLE
mgnify:CR=1 FL=1